MNTPPRCASFRILYWQSSGDLHPGLLCHLPGTGRLREATLTGLTSGLVSTIALRLWIVLWHRRMAAAWLITQVFAGIWALWRTRTLIISLRENHLAQLS
jgi:hypothetical protein